MIPDLDEVVTEIVHIGRTWCGTLPPAVWDTSNHRRINSAAFSLLATIDGASSIEVQLTPKDEPDSDLGGQALHELFRRDERFRRDPALLDNNQRQFVARMQHLVDVNRDTPGPIDSLMRLFLRDVVTMLSQHYCLRLVQTDWDTGEHLSLGDDIAPDLPPAFIAAWDASEPTGGR